MDLLSLFKSARLLSVDSYTRYTPVVYVIMHELLRLHHLVFEAFVEFGSSRCKKFFTGLMFLEVSRFCCLVHDPMPLVSWKIFSLYSYTCNVGEP